MIAAMGQDESRAEYYPYGRLRWRGELDKQGYDTLTPYRKLPVTFWTPTSNRTREWGTFRSSPRPEIRPCRSAGTSQGTGS